jgi:DNA/RNA-binding domain of Phe-tRNA-synthetase-like protein
MKDWMFSVSGDVFESFPDYRVGWVATEIEHTSGSPEQIEELLRGAEQRARTVLAGTDLKSHPAIGAWRTTFSSLGWSASKFPSSIEALARRVVREQPLPSIHPVVDLVNAVSLTYLVPMGCHDMGVIGELAVRPARSGDEFLPMGDGDPEEPPEGEIIYVAGQSVRTRRWVWRQSRQALVGPGATHLFIPVDGFEVTASNVDAAVNALAATLTGLLGATVQTGQVNRDQMSAVISLTGSPAVQ